MIQEAKFKITAICIGTLTDKSVIKENIRILHDIFSKAMFWPKITTQIAITIYITDKKSDKTDFLLQKNIQAICSCSAYAFHRTRNKLQDLLNISL